MLTIKGPMFHHIMLSLAFAARVSSLTDRKVVY